MFPHLPKFPIRVKNANQVIRILKQNGFVLSRQRGSHAIFRNNILNVSVTIPLHGGNKLLPIGTFISIVKQSKLPKSAFEN
jgi:predicted RNA binding protein YcfA (HicA-like mRNA interferase family)